MNQDSHDFLWNLIRYAPLQIGLHKPLLLIKRELTKIFDQYRITIVNDYKYDPSPQTIRHLMRLNQYIYAQPWHARRAYDCYFLTTNRIVDMDTRADSLILPGKQIGTVIAQLHAAWAHNQIYGSSIRVIVPDIFYDEMSLYFPGLCLNEKGAYNTSTRTILFPQYKYMNQLMSPERFFLSVLSFRRLLNNYESLRHAFLSNLNSREILKREEKFIYIDLPISQVVSHHGQRININLFTGSIEAFYDTYRRVSIEDVVLLITQLQDCTVVVADWMYSHLIHLCKNQRIISDSMLIDDSMSILSRSLMLRNHSLLTISGSTGGAYIAQMTNTKQLVINREPGMQMLGLTDVATVNPAYREMISQDDSDAGYIDLFRHDTVEAYGGSSINELLSLKDIMDEIVISVRSFLK